MTGDRPTASARAGRSGVPVQALQRDGTSRCAADGATDEVVMTTTTERRDRDRHPSPRTGEVPRASYTVTSAIAFRSIEVLAIAGCMGDCFRCRRRRVGARIVGVADQERRLATPNVRLGTGSSCHIPRRGSLLPGARRVAAGAQRAGTAAAAGRAHRHADHLHHRTRRHTDDAFER